MTIHNLIKMAKILLAGVQGMTGSKLKPTSPVRPPGIRSRLDKGQCAYYKEYGHWKRELPLTSTVS